MFIDVIKIITIDYIAYIKIDSLVQRFSFSGIPAYLTIHGCCNTCASGSRFFGIQNQQLTVLKHIIITINSILLILNHALQVIHALEMCKLLLEYVCMSLCETYLQKEDFLQGIHTPKRPSSKYLQMHHDLYPQPFLRSRQTACHECNEHTRR